MTGADSPFLRIATWGLTGLAAAAWLTGLSFALDRISTASGLFRGFSAAMLGDVAMALALFGLSGAVLIVNARRVEADGASRLAWALVGVVAVVVGCAAFGFSGLVASETFETPGHQSFNNQLVGAAVLPLLMTLCAVGCVGAWASVSAAPPAWGFVRHQLVRALCGASGVAALLVLVATVRAAGHTAQYVGAPMIVTLSALTAALAMRSRKSSSVGELAGALAGYLAAAVAAVIACGVLDAWASSYDPRARFLEVVFMGPVLTAALMVVAAAVFTVAGSFRETFGRVRRALA